MLQDLSIYASKSKKYYTPPLWRCIMWLNIKYSSLNTHFFLYAWPWVFLGNFARISTNSTVDRIMRLFCVGLEFVFRWKNYVWIITNCCVPKWKGLYLCGFLMLVWQTELNCLASLSYFAFLPTIGYNTWSWSDKK